MDVEEEPRCGPEEVQLLRNEHAVGAEIDVFAAFEDAMHELADLRVDQRLAAADAHDGCAGFIDGVEALLDRQFLLDRALVFADAAAPGTREIAGVERLQHQYEWEARIALEFLLDHVACHIGGQAEWKTHEYDTLSGGHMTYRIYESYMSYDS